MNQFPLNANENCRWIVLLEAMCYTSDSVRAALMPDPFFFSPKSAVKHRHFSVTNYLALDFLQARVPGETCKVWARGFIRYWELLVLMIPTRESMFSPAENRTRGLAAYQSLLLENNKPLLRNSSLIERTGAQQSLESIMGNTSHIVTHLFLIIRRPLANKSSTF